jgi:lipid-A-disaccharide synthase
MKYFIVAGEASGDLHGANLIKSIKQKDNSAQFNFWGGDKMAHQAQGLLMHYKNVSIMGFVEVLMNLRSIFANIDLCKKQINSFNPDVVILIDFPGFNLRIAEFCKSKGIKVVYYISPKVWAWKENRAKKLEKYVDLLLLIFPFEVDYFKKWNVKTAYVGNPLLDEIQQFIPNPAFRKQNQLSEKPIIALLPGSRKQEIKSTLPLMIKLAKPYPDYQFLVAGAPSISKEFYSAYENDNVKIIYNQTYDILSQSTAAIVCSGTATLETALFNIPQICAYVAHPISYRIAKMLVKIKYISLVNLNLNSEVICELIQDDFNENRLKLEFEAIMPNGNKREIILNDYASLRDLFGVGASDNAAIEIYNLLC